MSTMAPLADLPRPIRTLLEQLASLASQRHEKLLIVGGYVRDVLLGKPTVDLDLMVEGDAIGLAQAAAALYGGQVYSHTPFGTAAWEYSLPDTSSLVIDFATARTESYPTPAVLPTVQHGTVEQDLARRDFTINAMALWVSPPPLGRLLDLHHGLADLQQGIIRVLHDRSFIDDPTRLFRAVRFAQRFGFQWDAHSFTLIPTALPYMRLLTGERIRYEIEMILCETFPEHCIVQLAEFGILQAANRWLSRLAEPSIRPLLIGAFAQARLFITTAELDLKAWQLTPADLPNLYWAILGAFMLTEASEVEQLAASLQMSRTLVQACQQGWQGWRASHALSATLTPSQVDTCLETVDAIGLAAAWCLESDLAIRAAIARQAQVGRHIQPSLKGEDLINVGLKPSPLFGKLLRTLRKAKLDGHVRTLDDERAYIANLLSEEL